MVRVCSGDDLPRGVKGKFYMLRSYGNTAHEMWDVSDPAKPLEENHVAGWGIAIVKGAFQMMAG